VPATLAELPLESLGDWLPAGSKLGDGRGPNLFAWLPGLEPSLAPQVTGLESRIEAPARVSGVLRVRLRIDDAIVPCESHPAGA
jgi:hypothetical protein